MVGQFFFSTLKSAASSRAASGVIVRERSGAVPLSSTRPKGPTVTGAPSGRPVCGSSCVTPTVPRRTVMVVVNKPAMVPLAAVFATSATTTVPRIPTTQFGVLISTESPGRILSFATAIASRPSPSSTVAVDGTSLTVRVDHSRTVTSALPPSKSWANDRSRVAIRSRRNTASRRASGTGRGRLARVAVTVPSSAATTPAGTCADPDVAAPSAASVASINGAENAQGRSFSMGSPHSVVADHGLGAGQWHPQRAGGIGGARWPILLGFDPKRG